MTGTEFNYPKEYKVLFSNDNIKWESLYEVNHNKGERTYIRLTDAETRYVKLLMNNSSGTGYGIREMKILDPIYSENINRFFINIASEFPRSFFPRYFHEEASYWTIVGVNADVKESLINEDGMIEVDKSSFSIEPMIYSDNKLITWNEAEKEQSLLNNYLPIPNVQWKYENLKLNVEAFASGEANKSSVLYASYKITNTGTDSSNGKLYLLLRPFQVNPYYQELNIIGGVSKISSVQIEREEVKVDKKIIYSLVPFDNAGALRFEEGNIVSSLTSGRIPENKSIIDQSNLGNGVLEYNFNLTPGEEKEVRLIIPFYESQENFGIQDFLQSREETY